ncbi:MAG TPA: MFS transporter [Candidatus Dormibacteraeota bacterium]|jgi:EmrB/QacA subfamily drug resistance transporter|nr:MFS transporter [Candidatus Dormibacteraeota bacterium]
MPSSSPLLAAAAEPAGDPRRWRSLPIMLTALFMALFDVFVVNVAAPSIQRDLGASSGGLELVLAGYSFTYAVGLVTGGRMGDMFGRRRLFVGGMAMFTVASLLCGVAPNIAVLVGGRLLQGIGAAAMVPQVLAMINVTFPPSERARALSFLGATVGIGTIAGQILGGALVQLNIAGLGWRPIFFVNLPVGILAVTGALRLLPESRAHRSQTLDPVGLVTLTAGLSALIVPLVLGRNEGWPLWTWGSLAASAVLLSGFALWERDLERRNGAPLVPPQLLRLPGISKGLAITAAYFTFFGGFLVVFTVFLQTGLGDSPLRAGMTLAPLGAAFAFASIAGRRVAARYGASALTAGTVLSAIGLLTLSLVIATSGLQASIVAMVPGLVVIGLGNGLVIPLLIGTVLAHVPVESSGAAAGVLTTTQQLSLALGVALIGLLFFTRLPSAGIAGAASVSLFVDLALVVVASALTLTLPRRRAQVAPVAASVEDVEIAA